MRKKLIKKTTLTSIIEDNVSKKYKTTIINNSLLLNEWN